MARNEHTLSRDRRRSPRRASDDRDARPRHAASRRDRSISPSARSRRHSPPRRRRSRDGSPRRARRDRSRSRSEERQRETLEAGSVLRARVHTVKAFGVFVALGRSGVHGLVHHSQVSDELSLDRDDPDEDKITAMEYFCPRDSQVYVKILDVREEPSGRKFTCSLKAVDQADGRDLDPANRLAQPRQGRPGGGPLRDDPPEMGSVHRGTVASLRPFGAFVRLEGFRSSALVHFSQISDHLQIDRDDSDEAKTTAVGQVLSIGETCWVKVVEIKEGDPERGPKIGGSIKLVSQKDGTDLDPHDLKYRPRQGEGEGGFRSNKPVGADAGKAEQGVVDWGYLNAEKVNMDPRYADYELVGTEVEQLGEGRLPLGGVPPDSGLGGGAVKQLSHRQGAAGGIGSVEEALAILRQHGKRKEKKAKAKKKHKEDKKEKKLKKPHKKKKKSSSKHHSSDSSDSPD